MLSIRRPRARSLRRFPHRTLLIVPGLARQRPHLDRSPLRLIARQRPHLDCSPLRQFQYLLVRDLLRDWRRLLLALGRCPGGLPRWRWSPRHCCLVHPSLD